MKEINLRDFYPWYMEDVMVEVTEEVAEELLAGQRYIKASRRRVYRNKAHFSLDAEDGIEYSACFSNPSPQELIERMERFEHICHALNSLPDALSAEPLGQSDCCRRRCDGKGHQRRHPAWLGEHEKIFGKSSVSLFFFPF